MAGKMDFFCVASSASIGRVVTVEIVKGSRKTIVSGNLLTVDPESGSIVLVQQQRQNDTSDQGDGVQKFILIPGSSIHTVQLESHLEGVAEDGAELREHSAGVFAAEDEATIESHGKRQEKEATIESHGKRTLCETVRIFDEFTLPRRHRLIDALNKYGIKFVEKPHVFVQNEDEAQVEEDTPSTVIALQSGGIKIYPPYGKNDIIGGGSIAVKELLHKLIEENVFAE